MESVTNFLSDFYNWVTDLLHLPRSDLRNVLKWVYWIVGILSIVAICYVLYNKFEKPVSAILLFMGGWMLLMYYWVKWFKLTEKRPDWPPFITPCPDFLTLLVSESTTGGAKCVDYVGIADPKAADPLRKASPSSINVQKTDPQFYFQVKSTVTDSQTNQPRKATAYELCNQAKLRGLVWSGVCEEV